jgi:hypothetical protein
MATAKRPGLGTVLAKPTYRRLFAAQTISRWGDTFNTVALVVLVFRLTGSGLGVTGAVIAEIAPVLLLASAFHEGAVAVVSTAVRGVSGLLAATTGRLGMLSMLPRRAGEAVRSWRACRVTPGLGGMGRRRCWAG